MKDNFKYDPEDIESLLLHKQFSELFDEEKEFVLRYIGNEEEYESLRQTLFHMQDAPDYEEWLEPDPDIKKNLLAEFAGEEKFGFKIWLNNLFHGIIPDWVKQPAFGVVFATACVAIVVMIFLKNRNSAELQQSELAVVSEQTQIQSEDSVTESKRLFAENLTAHTLPPAPEEVVPFNVPVEHIPVEALKSVPVEEKGTATQEIAVAEDADFNREQEAAPAVTSATQSKRPTSDGATSFNKVTTDAKKTEATSEDFQKSLADVQTITEETGVQSATWTSQNNMTAPGGNYTISSGQESLSPVAVKYPDAAPVSDVRDVLDLLFTSK